MNHADNTRDKSKVHSVAKKLFSKPSGLSENIKDSQGQLVTDANERIETWERLFEQLLNTPAPAETHKELSTANPFSGVDTALCQSVISGSLTLRNTKIRDFGVKF